MKYKLKDSSELGQNIRIYHGDGKLFNRKLQVSLLVSNLILMTSEPYVNQDERVFILSSIVTSIILGNASLIFFDRIRYEEAKDKLVTLQNILKEKNINIELLKECTYDLFEDGEILTFKDDNRIVYVDNKYMFQTKKETIEITEDVNKVLRKKKKGKQNK